MKGRANRWQGAFSALRRRAAAAVFTAGAARGVAGAILAGVALVASGAGAQTADGEAAPLVVPLDQLLRLPTSVPVKASIEKRGGSTRVQWQSRFESVRTDLEDAEHALSETREALQVKAGEESQWKMSAPGLGQGASNPSNAPLDYRLSQDLRRQREELERARTALRNLETEANLAGVPDAWRQVGEPDLAQSEEVPR